jgi:hypothetical protein
VWDISQFDQITGEQTHLIQLQHWHAHIHGIVSCTIIDSFKNFRNLVVTGDHHATVGLWTLEGVHIGNFGQAAGLWSLGRESTYANMIPQPIKDDDPSDHAEAKSRVDEMIEPLAVERRRVSVESNESDGVVLHQNLYDVVMAELNDPNKRVKRTVKRLEPEPMDKGEALLQDLMETALSVSSQRRDKYKGPDAKKLDLGRMDQTGVHSDRGRHSTSETAGRDERGSKTARMAGEKEKHKNAGFLTERYMGPQTALRELREEDVLPIAATRKQVDEASSKSKLVKQGRRALSNRKGVADISVNNLNSSAPKSVAATPRVRDPTAATSRPRDWSAAPTPRTRDQVVAMTPRLRGSGHASNRDTPHTVSGITTPKNV